MMAAAVAVVTTADWGLILCASLSDASVRVSAVCQLTNNERVRSLFPLDMHIG